MENYIVGDWVYDIETYPSCFTFCIIRGDGKHMRVFEVSTRKNEFEKLMECLEWLEKKQQRLVGFNNIGFDYPIVHEIYSQWRSAKHRGKRISFSAQEVYAIAQQQIESFKGEFGHTIKAQDVLIDQLDLFKIHHFDNKAKSTSLKMLQFNMRSDNIEDLPYPVGTYLTHEEMDVLVKYNKHDVNETLRFYVHSLPAIRLRASLTEQYRVDFTNFNDTKIGKEYFINKLEEAMPGVCYKIDPKTRRRKINQTKRPVIFIKDCLFDYYDFKRPEFQAVLAWFKKQRINETKGVFSDIPEHELGEVAQYANLETKKKRFKGEPTKYDIAEFKKQYPMGWVEEQELKATVTVKNPDGTKTKVQKKSYWMNWKEASTLNVVVEGFQFDFGTGGIHGSILNKVVHENNNWKIRDFDVESFYPNMAISNRVYPKHLTDKFCDIYKDVFDRRKSYKKGTPENAVMKLALNGVYGDSNNKYSPFYDPQYTMKITIGGQLTLCLLVDMWWREGIKFKMMMANTDGVTICVHIDDYERCDQIAKQWEEKVKLKLECVDYRTMCIRDVNNYLAVYKE